MGWASKHIYKLLKGKTVSFRPRGNSMTPKISSGQLCTVAPITPNEIQLGDVVLCKVRMNEYLHIVKAIQGEWVLIGNNHGYINGWTHVSSIYGRLVKAE